MAWTKLINSNATVYDTVSLIIRTINEYADSNAIRQATAEIKKEYPGDFFRGLFNYVCKNVEYEKDPSGHEYVTTPKRLLQEGKGDCKKMSVFISAVLKHSGIRNYLRIVSYDGESFAHIYVIVPGKNGGYLTLDPVNNCRYDDEVCHVKSQTYNLDGKKMELSQMGRTAQRDIRSIYRKSCQGIAELDNDLFGIAGPEEFISQYLNGHDSMSGDDDDFEIDELGKKKKRSPEQKQKRKEKRKEKRKKLVNKIKKGGLAPARGAFLILVSTNILKWGNKLASAWNNNPKKLADFWAKLGGDPEKLKSAIEKGSKQQIQGLGVVAAATIGTAAAIAIAIGKFLKESGLLNKKDQDEVDKFVEEMEKEKDDDDDDGEAKAGSMWMGCWTNPVSVSMNILKGLFYLGADTQVNGPITQLFHIIKQLF